MPNDSQAGKKTKNSEINPDEGLEQNEEQFLSESDAEANKQFGTPNKLYESGILPITIIGEIEGHIELGAGRKATKYEHIIPLILEAEQNPEVKGVLLILNTMGGDVEAGLAISELVAGMRKPTVSLVLGGGHSIGVPLAVSTDYSFIAPTATMTIHPIRMNGLVIGVAQSFEYFKRMQDRIVDFVVSHSSISESYFMHYMLNAEELVNDVGSILIGKKAVEVGLIDSIGSISSALEKLKFLIDKSYQNSGGSIEA
ncbi:MAG: ATP-dependent Clp protease proteolytic subunit [Eubacteriaceae bacterium]|jgi:ATP-dependent protease ClpP protease subunit|nr:ATP-dependent Clp protease proteolytic subunit [Eubacteriaceae bacterium]